MAKVYNLSKMFKSPKKRSSKKSKKASACAPKVPYNTCQSKMKDCMWVHGKREYCRTRKNKRS